LGRRDLSRVPLPAAMMTTASFEADLFPAVLARSAFTVFSPASQALLLVVPAAEW